MKRSNLSLLALATALSLSTLSAAKIHISRHSPAEFQKIEKLQETLTDLQKSEKLEEELDAMYLNNTPKGRHMIRDRDLTRDHATFLAFDTIKQDSNPSRYEYYLACKILKQLVKEKYEPAFQPALIFASQHIGNINWFCGVELFEALLKQNYEPALEPAFRMATRPVAERQGNIFDANASLLALLISRNYEPAFQPALEMAIAGIEELSWKFSNWLRIRDIFEKLIEKNYDAACHPALQMTIKGLATSKGGDEYMLALEMLHLLSQHLYAPALSYCHEHKDTLPIDNAIKRSIYVSADNNSVHSRTIYPRPDTSAKATLKKMYGYCAEKLSDIKTLIT
ncbi:hypothetical protein IPF37_05210 [bacterium]|nr:MAG: hypothetical protein IPF37_05210 [bacterium]